MIIPDKLKIGDEIRIIAPARSLGLLSDETKAIADSRLKDLGFTVTFGNHVDELDQFASSTIESRIDDLHQAFADKNVKGILTVIGGFNSNQLLSYIDWDLIKANPKIFCGYSDITALNNAIFAKSGLVSYSGPHYSSFGQKLHFEYTLDYFKKCCMSDDAYTVLPSKEWSDDQWYKNQDDRNLVRNEGWLVINEGEASGTIIGSNLCTLNLLQGTDFFPNLKDTALFLEDDSESLSHTFDRDLQSLIHLPDFSEVRAIIIGRFQKASEMTNDKIIEIIRTKKELDSIPVVANVDFGHTDPRITFPIGGRVSVRTMDSGSSIKIESH